MHHPCQVSLRVFWRDGYDFAGDTHWLIPFHELRNLRVELFPLVKVVRLVHGESLACEPYAHVKRDP
jgi:hypothetical protein